MNQKLHRGGERGKRIQMRAILNHQFEGRRGADPFPRLCYWILPVKRRLNWLTDTNEVKARDLVAPLTLQKVVCFTVCHHKSQRLCWFYGAPTVIASSEQSEPQMWGFLGPGRLAPRDRDKPSEGS